MSPIVFDSDEVIGDITIEVFRWRLKGCQYFIGEGLRQIIVSKLSSF